MRKFHLKLNTGYRHSRNSHLRCIPHFSGIDIVSLPAVSVNKQECKSSSGIPTDFLDAFLPVVP